MVFDGDAPERGALSRAGGAQRRRLELRQDLPRHRLEGRLRGRAGGAERRVPQGAPVQRLHRQHADAARHRRATWPTRRTTSGCRRSTAPSATGSAPAWRRRGCALLPCQGTYFQCVDYSAVSDLGEDDFCRWLTTEIGVAAIPLSAFYADGFEQRIARFCFAKKDETLDARARAPGRALTRARAAPASAGAAQAGRAADRRAGRSAGVVGPARDVEVDRERAVAGAASARPARPRAAGTGRSSRSRSRRCSASSRAIEYRNSSSR